MKACRPRTKPLTRVEALKLYEKATGDTLREQERYRPSESREQIYSSIVNDMQAVVEAKTFLQAVLILERSDYGEPETVVGGARLRREWPREGDVYERKHCEKDPLYGSRRDFCERENEVRLPYTEAAWEALTRLQDRIRQAHLDLAEILKRPDLGKILEAAAGMPSAPSSCWECDENLWQRDLRALPRLRSRVLHPGRHDGRLPEARV